jgi:alkanesulfonate monooxygenase SsuD/methylene tetrahydromethanopterin reductase-like flavin-dependent oxidoreductase (luciferase family)
MPEGDRGLGQGFEDLIKDRFLIGSPDEVAEEILKTRKRVGMNHIVMSTEWAGMPESLAIETMEMIAKEVFPRVRQAL